MPPKKKTKNVVTCCFGGTESKAVTQINKTACWTCKPNAHEMIKCTNCHLSFCIDCAEKLLTAANIKYDTIHPVYLKRIYNAVEEARMYSKEMTVELCHKCCRDFQHVPSRQEVEQQQQAGNVGLHFDGFLVLPEFGLMIDTPIINERIKCVDVHGLGKEEGCPAPLHYVIPEHKALQLHTEVRAITMTESVAHCYRFTRTVVYMNGRDFFNENSDSETIGDDEGGDRAGKICFAIDVILVQGLKPCTNTDKMGCHPIDDDLVTRYTTFTKEDRFLVSQLAHRETKWSRRRVVRCTMILGVFEGSLKKSLLLCRFYDTVGSFDKDQVPELYEKLSRLTANDNVERKRVGGSSGIYRGMSPAIYKMLDNPNFTPRKRSGVVLMIDRLTITAVYIAANGDAKTYTYSNPQPGGQIEKLDRKLFWEYEFFIPFTESKIYAAKILSCVAFTEMFGVVVPKAVNSELASLRRAFQYANGSELKVDKTKDRRTVVLYHYCSFNNLTLVQHSVGQHRDNFGEHYSLENKIAFKTKHYCHQYGIGRGSAGNNHFVFCLLDWTNYARERRAMVQATIGENTPARVTNRVWAAFLLNNQPMVQPAIELGLHQDPDE